MEWGERGSNREAQTKGKTMETKERLNAERDTRRTEYRAALEPARLAKVDRRYVNEDERGIKYEPFNSGMLGHQQDEVHAEQVFTGCLGTIVRDLLKVEEEIRIYADLTEEGRARLFPQGLNPTFETALDLYRRWDQLDIAHLAVLARIAQARLPRPRVLSPEDRIAALEAKLASIECA